VSIDSTEAGAGAKGAAQAAIFAQNGEYWTIGYADSTFSLKDIKGLSYLQRLLQSPGEQFLALDLANESGISSATDSQHEQELLADPNITVGGLGDAGEMLDLRAKEEYRRRLQELKGTLEDLVERGDLERAEQTRSEIEFLEHEILRAIGIGGRQRRAGSASERARLSVSRAIKAALQKISEHHAPLGEILLRSVRTGTFCSAGPQTLVNWQFSSAASPGKLVAEESEPLIRPWSETDLPGVFSAQTKFVGREAERVLLSACLDQVMRSEGRVVMISGEPGVGKTRLAREFGFEAALKGVRVLVGGCYDRDNPVPFSPLVEMLEMRAHEPDQARFREMLGNDASEIARLMPELRRLFPDIPAPEEYSAEQSRQTLFTAISETLVRISAKQPVLCLLEDLHWADEGTLSLLSYLSRRLTTMPVMVVGTHRQSNVDPGSALAKTLDELIRFRILERIELRGLPRGDVGEMLSVLSGREPQAELVNFILANTDGNPFFIEELYRHLLERGQLTDITGELSRELKLGEVDVPQSVKLVIGRRLAQLTAQTQAVLGFAAVTGRSFTFELLEAASGEDTEPLLDHLEAAEGAGLISSVLDYPAARFRFSHELVRQAVLESVSPPRRQRIHLRLARATERIYANALEDHAIDLAYHMLEAGEANNDRAGTVRYLAMAAKREISQSAYSAAEFHLKSALELLPKLPESTERDRTELDLLSDYGVTLFVLKGWYVPEVGEVYKRAMELCRKLGETQQLMSVLFGLTAFHLCLPELGVCETYVNEMISLASSSAEDNTVMVAWSLGVTKFFRGEFAEAHENFDQAIRHYDRKRHRGIGFLVGQDLCAGSLVYDAMALMILGFPDQAEKRLNESLSLARDLGYPFTLTYCLVMAAKYCCIRRDFDRLPWLAHTARALAHEHGFTFWEEGITAYEPIGLALQEKKEELKISFQRAKKYSEVRYELAQTWARANLAEGFTRLGRVSAASSLLTEAFAMMNRNGERYAASEISRIRGVLALKQIEGRECSAVELQSAQVEAEHAFREAIEIAHRQGAKLYELRAAADLGRLLTRSGRSDEARRILGEIYNSFTEGFDAPDLRDARSVLEKAS